MSRNNNLSVYLLEDDPSQNQYYTMLLREEGFNVTSSGYYEDAVEAIRAKKYDAFVIDISIDIRKEENMGKGGDDIINLVLQEYPGAPIAVISGYIDDTWSSNLTKMFMSATSMHYAHIKKPGENELKDWAKKIQTYLSAKQESTASSYHSSDSRVKQIVNDLIPTVAMSQLPVFLIGETGTGKEGIARLIHNHPNNPFHQGPFIAVNCAAVSDELLLSELFGHVQGAYTGAYTHRLGLFLEASGWKESKKDAQHKHQSILSWLKSNNDIKYAKSTNYQKYNDQTIMLMNNPYINTDQDSADYIYADTVSGTLFLDEIADLSPTAEAALLRALDGYGIRPLGYTGPAILPNCCIIAATNRINSTDDLIGKERHHKSGLRKEIYYRLAGWVLELPPLRERMTKRGYPEWAVSLYKWAARDNLQFAEGALEDFTQSMIQKNGSHLWDGNWRELKYYYARLKTSVKQQNSRIIRQEDMEFAIQWVLLSDLDDHEETGNGILHDKEVLIRLDCILILYHATKEPGASSEEMDLSSLELVPEAAMLAANEPLLQEALQSVKENGRITNASVDILMGKKGALKAWWKGNATLTAIAANGSKKYKPIINIIAKLSPSNFHINPTGSLEASKIGF